MATVGLMADYRDDKGVVVRTLEVSSPGIRGQKIVVNAIPLTSLLMVFIFSYFAFVLYQDDPTLQMIYLLSMVFFVASDIFMFLLFQSAFGRNWSKIEFFDNGIQFPRFLWDRLMGREGYLARSKIVSVKADIIANPGVVGTNTGELIFTTNSGKRYRTGFRIKEDVLSTSEWIEENWQMKVDVIGSNGNPILAPHMAPVSGSVRSIICVGCGYVFTGELGFCPCCGRMVTNEKDQTEITSYQRLSERPQVVVQDPLSGSSHNQTPSFQNAQYQNQNQKYPVYQGPYGQSGLDQPNQAFPGPAAYYGQNQYPQQYAPYAKNPRLATKLAAVLGLLGIMGIGHLYMRKPIKGILLLFIGGFFALLSSVSIIMIFQPSEFSMIVRVITAAMMSAPFLLIYLWQVFDAPKPSKAQMKQDRYGYYRPPYGP
jgi:TM2 domain-containing membrane protein YozV